MDDIESLLEEELGTEAYPLPELKIKLIKEKDIHEIVELSSKVNVVNTLLVSIEEDKTVSRAIASDIKNTYEDFFDTGLSLEQFTTFRSETNYDFTHKFLKTKKEQAIQLLEERVARLKKRAEKLIEKTYSAFGIINDLTRVFNVDFTNGLSCETPKILYDDELKSVFCAPINIIYSALYDYRNNSKLALLESAINRLLSVYGTEKEDKFKIAMKFLYSWNSISEDSFYEDMAMIPNEDVDANISIKDIIGSIYKQEFKVKLINILDTIPSKKQKLFDLISLIWINDYKYNSEYITNNILEAEKIASEIEEITNLCLGLRLVASNNRGLIIASKNILEE
jgi:hypothetical protein